MSILLDDITKRYEGQAVVNHVHLEIDKGEFFVLLGSSGSGKTTILNLIAGLTSLDHGRIFLHDREVTHLPTQQRRVGFVFQHYALFQHMTVAENIDFGPSIHKVAKHERSKRSEELLELVGLSGLADRMPRQLSGGQQQRVALARALALEPDVLLLDEPLGALDAKIRQELRRNLRVIQRRLGITTILVTHDQEEAFDLADRIGVMSYGRLVEVGKPEDLYQSPQTEFVASFLGSANLLVGDAVNGRIQIGSQIFPIDNPSALAGRRVQVLFRPEDVALACDANEMSCPQLGWGEVEEISYGGPVERLRLRLPPSAGIRPISPAVPFGSSSILVDASRSPDESNRIALTHGDRVLVGIRRIHAIANPGLSVLIATDGSLRADAALDLGGHISRLAHARVILLGYGTSPKALEDHLQKSRKDLGQGLSALDVRYSSLLLPEAVANVVERQPCDLVVTSFNINEQLHDAEKILQAGEHNLLLAPRSQPAPTKILICMASGEPGKHEIFFIARLMHHLGCEATLTTVIPQGGENLDIRKSYAQAFLQNGLKSLSLLGISAETKLRIGPISHEIIQEAKEGGYDMVVLGAPLPMADGQFSMSGVIAEVLAALDDRAVLIVRSYYTDSHTNPFLPRKRFSI